MLWITPENVTDEITYAYASSDETVATVDESGRISAVQAGNTEITVTVTAGEFTKELTFDLEVKEIPLEGITFKEEITPLEEGQSAQLEILFNPENTTVDRTVTWLSSDESVATIEDGLVTAVKAGTTTISATVGDKEISYELTVTERRKNRHRAHRMMKNRHRAALQQMISRLREQINLYQVIPRIQAIK